MASIQSNSEPCVKNVQLLRNVAFPDTWFRDHETIKKDFGMTILFKPSEYQGIPVVERVFTNGPADIAGIVHGDLLAEVNGKPTWQCSKSVVRKMFNTPDPMIEVGLVQNYNFKE